MRKLAIGLGALALTLPATGQTLEGVDAGIYELEKTHAFLTWSVRHNGISDYIVNFTDFDATLDFDPAAPENSALEVTINPTALETKYPDPEKKVEWENELAFDPRFMNANEFPTITFVSTDVAVTGEFAGTVTGDVTFLGVTKPVTLNVEYGGVANPPWFAGRDVIGFTATGTLNRTDFGSDALLAAASDEVTISFSGEFLQVE